MIAPSQLPHMINEVPAAPMTRLPRRRSRRAEVPTGDVAIRAASERDAAVLRELEELDGRELPVGRHLVAEIEGVAVAAIAVADDTVVADPFAPTSAVVDLLRVRARQLRVAA